MEKHARNQAGLNNKEEDLKRKNNENSEEENPRKRPKSAFPLDTPRYRPENHHLKDFLTDPWTIERERTFRSLCRGEKIQFEPYKINYTNYPELIRQQGGAQTRCVYIYINTYILFAICNPILTYISLVFCFKMTQKLIYILSFLP